MLYFRHIAASFSTAGLILGMAFFCTSLTPSLLPRDHFVQGILSGVVFATGYGIGRLGHWIWKFMELKDLSESLARKVTWVLVSILTLSTIFTLNQIITWQNSIRLRMEMVPIETTYLITLCGISIITALLIIFLMRVLLYITTRAVDKINRYLPRRIAIILGYTVFVLLLLSFVNGVIIKGALHAMDESFAAMNKLLDSEYDQPLDSESSGSAQSLISWSDIGRNGKRFVADGPTKAQITAVLRREAMQPILLIKVLTGSAPTADVMCRRI